MKSPYRVTTFHQVYGARLLHRKHDELGYTTEVAGRSFDLRIPKYIALS